MSLRIFIAVTHLLGAGHLIRAAAIGRALAQAGHRVTLVSGGMPAGLAATDGLALTQLPPVRATDEDFSRLSDEAGREVGPDRLAARRDLLLATLRNTRPDMVVTELFPFGRRVLAAEFRALLDAAENLRPKPLVLCSVRDILVAPVKPGRVEEAHRLVARHYDAVLVHGDPDLVRLEASWPLDAATASRLLYTGYVDAGERDTPSPALRFARDDLSPTGRGIDERWGPDAKAPDPEAPILVSGGSSAAALPLYRAALGAALTLPERRWRILVGAGVAESEFAALSEAAPPNVAAERARTDFRALLQQAAAFVGLAGYNTVLDLVDARVRAVLVPFERGRETEQRVRAERLAARGLALLLPEAELSAESLAGQIRRALAAPRPPEAALDRNGAEATVRIVEDLAGRRAERLGAPAGHVPILARATRALVAESLNGLMDEGRQIAFWWRDDDAVAHTPALDRMLALARHAGMPLAVAAIPARTEPSLVERLAGEESVAVLVHGLAHTNHAPDGSKKAEFGPHRLLTGMCNEAAEALGFVRDRFGPRALPVFVPPWNRIAPDLVPALPGLGFHGLSVFGPRSAAAAVPGLTVVNTRLDPVDWRGSRSLVDAAAFERMWRRALAADEPVGLLTHHLVADEAVWAFCEALLEILADHAAVTFAALAKLWLPASTHSPHAGA